MSFSPFVIDHHNISSNLNIYVVVVKIVIIGKQKTYVAIEGRSQGRSNCGFTIDLYVHKSMHNNA